MIGLLLGVLLLAVVAAVAGIGLGILMAARIERLTTRDDEPEPTEPANPAAVPRTTHLSAIEQPANPAEEPR